MLNKINKHMITFYLKNKFLRDRYLDNYKFNLSCPNSRYLALRIFFDVFSIIKKDTDDAIFLFKPYENLKYSHKTINKTLLFLKDCYQFSKNDQLIYKNDKLKSELIFVNEIIDSNYIDLDKTFLLNHYQDNIEIGMYFRKNIFLHKRIEKPEQLINWRSKKQWDFYKKIEKNIKLSININNTQPLYHN